MKINGLNFLFKISKNDPFRIKLEIRIKIWKKKKENVKIKDQINNKLN